MATKAYLSTELEYDDTNGVVHLPKIMSWFRDDFGGKKGMIQIAKKLAIIPADAHPTIQFKDYNWSLTLKI